MARGVRPDDAFVERFEELVPSAAARDAIVQGIATTLAEAPEVGDRIDDQPGSCWLALVPDAPGWGTGRMILLYSFDDDELRLHWINPGG